MQAQAAARPAGKTPPHRMCPPPVHPPVKSPLARDGAPEAELLKCGSCRLRRQRALGARSARLGRVRVRVRVRIGVGVRDRVRVGVRVRFRVRVRVRVRSR